MESESAGQAREPQRRCQFELGQPASVMVVPLAGMGTGRLVDLSAGIPIPADNFANELSTCVSSGAEVATRARSRCSFSIPLFSFVMVA